jgi:4a-hydroxytetrahydrobiopterin dehydratase
LNRPRQSRYTRKIKSITQKRGLKRMARRRLTGSEIEENLAGLNDWTVANEKLARKFAFKNFAEALEFVNKIGVVAEAADHHPDILFGWGYAEIFITTHDTGGITERDFALAREINKL